MHRDENGYIVVETVGAFIPFLLLVISILSLVNLVAVQARIHFAMTQAANTISMYSYVLELLDVANDLTTLDTESHKAETGINEIKEGIDAILSGLDGISGIGDIMDKGAEVQQAYDYGAEMAGDPKGTLRSFINYGVDNALDMLFDELARPLVGRYLASADMTGNEYLLWANVLNRKTGRVGLEALEFYSYTDAKIGESSLIDRNGIVRLTVEYEIAYTFGGLKLPFAPTLRITQTVVTKAWLNGSGKGYW